MNFMLIILMVFLGLAMLFMFIRMFSNVTVFDRMILLNMITAKVILFIVVYAVYVQSPTILDIAITYGIIGFLTTTLFSKFVMTGTQDQ
jgi:multicomponent Na+:H+ antiporter subunit F